MHFVSSKIFSFVSCLIIITLGFVIYSNSFNNGFHFDDMFFILNKAQIRDLSDLSAIWNAHSHPARFIGFLSFALNYHFHQYNVFGYHVVNWLIHIANGLMVWWLVHLLFRTDRLKSDPLRIYVSWTSLLAALIFISHPLQTQAVTYITQRFASLATLFYLLSVCTFLKARLSSSRLSGVWFALCAVSALAGMFTKQIVFTLPLTIILIELIFVKPKQINWRLIGMVALFLLIVPGIFSFRADQFLNIKHMSESHEGDHLTSGIYFLTQLRVLITYLRLLVVPVGQNLDYDYPAITDIFDPRVWICFLALSALFVAGLSNLRRRPLIGFGILWFFVTISVESTFITIKNVIFEHRLYLPMIGVSLVAVFGLLTAVKRIRPVITVFAVVIVLFSVLTYQRNFIWRDSITLWTDVVQKSPNKARPWVSLGIAYIQQDKYETAYEHLTRALEINPKEYKALNNLGLIYARRGEFKTAVDYYDQAIAVNPRSPVTLNNRGDAYRNLGEDLKAFEDFNQAVSLNPYYAEAFVNRGVFYGRRDQRQNALEDFNQAIRLNPTLPEPYNNRGIVYQQMNELDKAERDFVRALKLKPDYEEALYNRGNVYKARGEFDAALTDYRQALVLKNNYSEVYNNRGIIHGSQGRNDLALEDFNLAIRHNPDYSAAYFNRSLVHMKSGAYQQALDDTLKARALGKSVNPIYIQQIQTLIQSQ